jgi:hypothetical protein
MKIKFSKIVNLFLISSVIGVGIGYGKLYFFHIMLLILLFFLLYVYMVPFFYFMEHKD